MKSPLKKSIGEVVTDYGARVMKVFKKGLLQRSLFDFYGDVKADKLRVKESASVPATPVDGDGGVMYTKSADGKLYYKSNEVAEVEISSSGATLTTEQVQDIVGAMVDGGTETNIAVTYDDTGGKLNFVSTNTTYSEATGSAEGLMSTAHHDKLDNIEPNATADQTQADINALNITADALTSGNKTLDGTFQSKGLVVDGNVSVTPGDGVAIHVDASDITDNNTSASGTSIVYSHINFENPRLFATNSNVTTTNAFTLYIKGAPVASTNQTITNAYSIYVQAGTSYFGGAITANGGVTGNVSGSSGSCTGNAATATALQTARNIGGVSFNGTANINLPGVNTSGTQDTSGNAATADALTSGSKTITGGLTVTTELSSPRRKFVRTSTATHFEVNGDVLYFGSGSTTQGDLCYLKEDGSWGQADADGAATGDDADRDAMGMLAIALGTDPDVDGMFIKGIITMDSDMGDVGNPIYVKTTAGGMSHVAPSGSGDFVRVVGYCLDDDHGIMYFNPDNTWVEIA